MPFTYDGSDLLSTGEIYVDDIRRVLREGDEPTLKKFFSGHTDLSSSTQRTYRAAWSDFRQWCAEHEEKALPAHPETVVDYVKDRSSELALSTIRNRLSVIGYAHRRANHNDPTQAEVMEKTQRQVSRLLRYRPRTKPDGGLEYTPREILEEGSNLLPLSIERALSNSRGEAEPGNAQPNEGEGATGEPATGARLLQQWERAWAMWHDAYVPTKVASPDNLTDEQRRLIPDVKYDLVTIRDRAILLLMTTGPVRRSDVPRMQCVDVVVEEEFGVGVRKKNGMPKHFVRLRRAGDLRYCPQRALAAWMLVAERVDGPLFRSFDAHGNMKATSISAPSINLIVRRWAEQAGLNPDDWTPGRLREAPE